MEVLALLIIATFSESLNWGWNWQLRYLRRHVRFSNC